jgi:hypothetical protein
MGEADWARCVLGYGRSKNLQNIVPVQMLVSVRSLRLVVAIGSNNKAVIRVDIPKPLSNVRLGKVTHLPRFITGMMTGSDSINIAPPCATSKGRPIVLRWRRKGKAHEMGNGGLTSPAAGVPYGALSLLASVCKMP